MKRAILFLSLLSMAVGLLPAAGSLAAEDTPTLSLEQILSRHATARGGIDAWRHLQTMKIEGQYIAFGKSGPFVLYRARSEAGQIDKLRFERPEPPYDAVIATDGESSWWINPWVGVEWAVPLPKAEDETLLVDTYFVNPLLEATAKGNQVELVGRTDFEGTNAYELKVVLSNGLEETWYLDAETFLELGSLGHAADYGDPKEARTFFDDFRDIDGLVMPFYIEREYGIRLRIIEVESVEFNPELSADLFRFPVPQPDGMQRLASLAGDWDVAVRSRDNPSFAWKEGETTSTVEATFHGLQLVETLRHEVVQPRTFFHTRAYDRFREVYRDTLFYDGLFHPLVLEGTFGEDGRLIQESVGEGAPYVTRLITSGIAEEGGISEDGFKVEEERSFDGGETWTPVVELTYTRRPAGD